MLSPQYCVNEGFSLSVKSCSNCPQSTAQQAVHFEAARDTSSINAVDTAPCPLLLDAVDTQLCCSIELCAADAHCLLPFDYKIVVAITSHLNHKIKNTQFYCLQTIHVLSISRRVLPRYQTHIVKATRAPFSATTPR